MANWLDYLLEKRKRGPDLAQPVPVGDPMKDLRAPLPEKPSETNQRRWDIYNRSERYRKWMTKERRA